MTEEKRIMGKKSRAAGQRFELKVKKDLESKGWIVSKWMNNVEFTKLIPTKATKQAMDMLGDFGKIDNPTGKLVPAKHKFRGVGIPMSIGTGMPDFVCIKVHDLSNPQTYLVKFVEAKTNGYVDKEEREKLNWLQKQGFNIEIASKGEKRGEIIYKEYELSE